MTYNTLTTLSFKVYKDKDLETNKETVLNLFNNIETVYSYIIKGISDNNRIGLSVKFTISENIKHNIVKTINLINKVFELLEKDFELNKIIAYEQPSLNIIFQVYHRFIAKIAKQQSLIWHLEYDDVYQICALSIVKLYNKNYYLNKYIVEKTCRNDVLYNIRKNINKPIIKSLDEVFKDGSDSNEEIKYCDIIEDPESRYLYDNSLHQKVIIDMFNDVKKLIVDRFGERKFDKLYKDYTNGHTDSISTTMMRKVKVYLKERNITIKSLEGEEYEP